jgi:hypothetical protein
MGGSLAFSVRGRDLTMSSKSFRSNPDPTFLLTGGIHCAYTCDNPFILTLFASVVSLITPTLRTHPCATLRRSPHPHGQQSPGLQPTQNSSQGRSSSSGPKPHGLLPDMRPRDPGRCRAKSMCSPQRSSGRGSGVHRCLTVSQLRNGTVDRLTHKAYGGSGRAGTLTARHGQEHGHANDDRGV